MTLSHPAAVMERLEEIDRDLAERQNDLEEAALAWFRTKRDKEQVHARAFIDSDGTAGERKAHADLAAADIGREEEASYEALKAVVRVLETRATIGQSILRAQSQVRS